MQSIQKYVDLIDEELCGAKNYAEAYVEWKAKKDSYWSQRFKECALDELKHAEYIHDLTVQEITRLKEVFTPPTEMQEKWDKSHKKYVEKASWVKQMLSM